MSDIQENIIPLYINSADRLDITDSTTDFTVALKKSLRNIVSLQVAEIVIPRNDTNINPSNDTLEGFIVVDGVSNFFSVEVPDSNYTLTTFAAALQLALNNNLTMRAYPITWTVAYDAVSNLITATATYTFGASATWGIAIAYTPIRDVIGIGVAGTTTQTFLAAAGSTVLVIPSGRSPVLLRTLSYNITSAALTNVINTSYIVSLNKFFNITSANETLVIESQIINNAFMGVIAPPIDPNLTAEQFGRNISISSSGNIVAVGTVQHGGAYTYIRTSSTGAWSQVPVGESTFRLSAGFVSNQAGRVAISGNGTYLALVLNLNSTSTQPVVYIYTINTTSTGWDEQDIIVPVSITSMFEIALDIDGATLVMTGNTTEVWARTGAVWALQQDLAVASTAVSISDAGDNLIIGGPGLSAQAWLRTGVVWAVQIVVLTAFAVSGVAMSGDANYFAISQAGGVATLIYNWTGAVWALQATLAVTSRSCALNTLGTRLAIGSPADGPTGTTSVYERVGILWSLIGTSLVGTGSVGAPQQGFSVDITGDGQTVVSGGKDDNSFNGAFWTFIESGSLYTQNGPKDIGVGGTLISQFVAVVMALSADGTHMAAGYPNPFVNNSAYVWARNGTEWTEEKIDPSNVIGLAITGSSVALSGDAAILAVGGQNDNAGIGAVWIFTRSGTTWSEQLKIPGGAPIANQGTRVALAPDGSYLVISGATDALRIMVQQGGTWVDKVVGLGAGILGGGTIRAIDISGDGLSIAIGSVSNGAAQFGLVNDVWVSQSPNFSTLHTPINASVFFGESVAISQDGLTMAVGDPGDRFNEGAAFVFTRPSFGGTWTEVASVFGTPEPGPPPQLQGRSVALINNGLTLIVGGPGGVGAPGAIWTFTAPTWVQTSGPTASDFVAMGDFISGQKGGQLYVVSAPNTPGTYYSAFLVFYPQGMQITMTTTFAIPNGAYTIFGLINLLNSLMNDVFDPGNGFSVAFDMTDFTATITAVVASPTLSNLFRVDYSASTFTEIKWPSTTFAASQTSNTIDFALNKNALKKVTNHSDNSDNVIVENSPNFLFRKYPAGYTIAAGVPIDIQLRDDHDAIVDLNGANWIMTIYANIRA